MPTLIWERRGSSCLEHISASNAAGLLELVGLLRSSRANRGTRLLSQWRALVICHLRSQMLSFSFERNAITFQVTDCHACNWKATLSLGGSAFRIKSFSASVILCICAWPMFLPNVSCQESIFIAVPEQKAPECDKDFPLGFRSNTLSS